MHLSEIEEKINKALSILHTKDIKLFEINVNERTLTHKLAEYLQMEFTDWNVDCEYNREGHKPKELDKFVEKISSDDEDAHTVYPDIIVHERDSSNNILVIETKKSIKSLKHIDIKDIDSKDKNKLDGYISELGYRHAYYVVFFVGTVSLIPPKLKRIGGNSHPREGGDP